MITESFFWLAQRRISCADQIKCFSFLSAISRFTLDDLCLIVIIQRLMMFTIPAISAAYITQCVGLAIPVARERRKRSDCWRCPALFAARQACYRPLQYCLVYWLRPVGYRAPLSEVWLVSNTPAPSATQCQSCSAKIVQGTGFGLTISAFSGVSARL